MDNELDDVSEQAVNAETAVQVQGLRLKADNIKWTLGRMNPKKYGDRTEVAITDGKALDELSDADLAAIAAGRAIERADSKSTAPVDA